MKRRFNSSPSPPLPLCNPQSSSDDLEPVRKRCRIFISSPTLAPNNYNQLETFDEEDDEQGIIADEPLISSVTFNEDRFDII